MKCSAMSQQAKLTNQHQEAFLSKRELADEKTPAGEHISTLQKGKKLFNFTKKVIDPFDDVWMATKSFLPPKIVNSVGSFLTGSIGIFTNFGESIIGLKQAIIAIRDKQKGQRKTRIASGITSAVLGATGTGLAASLIAGAAKAAVHGLTLLPVLVPTFLTAIYVNTLARRSYILNRAIKAEEEAFEAFQAFKKKHAKTIEELNDNIKNLEIESANYLEYPEKLSHITQQKLQHHSILLEYHRLEKNHQAARQTRLHAERKLAYNVIELSASLISLAATILSAGALIGAASVASFGILPTALLVTGFIIAVGLKIFEHIDERNNFRYSSAMRQWFVNRKNDITNFFFPKPKMEPTPRPYKPGVNTTYLFETFNANKPDADLTPLGTTPQATTPTPQPVVETPKPKTILPSALPPTHHNFALRGRF